MKKKVGTVIDEGLLRRAKAAAALEGLPLSKLFEEAVKEYLDRHGGTRKKSAVALTWRVIETDDSQLQAIMEEDGVLDA